MTLQINSMNANTRRVFPAILLGMFSLPLFLSAQRSAYSLIESELLKKAQADVANLAAPALEGRGYTGEGHLKGAQYLQDRFSEIGLKPLKGEFLQPFTVEVDTFKQTPTLIVDGRPLRFGEDFIINPGNSGAELTDLAVIRVGNGLVLPKQKINHFKNLPEGLQVEGGIAVIDTRTPPEIEEDTTVDRNRLSNEARINSAILRKAGGVILLVERPTYGHFSEHWPLPVFEVRRDALPESASEISLKVEPSGSVKITTNNVIGYLPGTEKTDSTIIICAHYDHLGGVGNGIYFPGANDNASGTALMLALAQRFVQHPLRFNLLFVAFSGEEIGLRGSKYFADHLPLLPEHVRFLINLDMAASGLQGIMALGGVDFPEEFALLQTIHDSLGLPELRKRENAPNSDHWFLLQKGIRGFYVYPFTGEQPYHHVDDRPETLEWETFERMYGLVKEFLIRMTDSVD